MRTFRSRAAAAAALAGVIGVLLAPLANAVTATVTDLGGQPVGVSTLTLDGVPVTPAGDGSYTLPPGTHEVTVTTAGGGTFMGQVSIPDGAGSGRLTLEPGFGGIGRLSFAPGPAPTLGQPGSGVEPREPVPVSGMAPREAGRFALTVQGGFEEWTLPRAASGVFVVGAGLDRAIKFSPEHVSGLGGGLRLTQKSFWPGVDLRYDFSYFDGDAHNTGQVQLGTDPVGWLYHDRAPNGSTGLGLGPSGMDVRTETDFRRYKLGLTLWDPDYGDGQGLIGNLDAGGSLRGSLGGYGGPKIGGGVGVFWQRFETDQRSWLMSPAFGDLLSSRFHQELTEDQFGLGGMVKLSVPLTGSASVFAKGGGAVIYRRADLDGKQWNRCDLCGPDEQLFVADSNDQDSGFTWAGNVALGLEVRLAPQLSVGAIGRYLYYRDTAEIVNPVQGDANLYRPTHLDDRRAHGWQAGLGINYQF
jgi:hypothetical protein